MTLSLFCNQVFPPAGNPFTTKKPLAAVSFGFIFSNNPITPDVMIQTALVNHQWFLILSPFLLVFEFHWYPKCILAPNRRYLEDMTTSQPGVYTQNMGIDPVMSWGLQPPSRDVWNFTRVFPRISPQHHFWRMYEHIWTNGTCYVTVTGNHIFCEI